MLIGAQIQFARICLGKRQHITQHPEPGIDGGNDCDVQRTQRQQRPDSGAQVLVKESQRALPGQLGGRSVKTRRGVVVETMLGASIGIRGHAYTR